MKNFTNNFKQFTSRLSARWLIMALMLLVGTSSAWGATRTFNNGDYIYIKNFKPSGWGDCWIPSNGYAWAHMWGGTAGEKDYLFELVSGTAGSVGAIYRAKITSSGTYTSIIFTRNSTNTGPWNDQWNKTGTITLPSSGDCATSFSSDGTSATWSTYTPPCDVTLSVSKKPDATIYLTSESVTLTAAATNQTSITWKKGDTTLGTGNSYAYTQSEVGSASIKAIAENTTCSVEKTVDLAFVNQKAIKITTNGNYYLYTWNGDNTDNTKNWPGIKGTQEGDVYVWTIETTKPINAILNKGNTQPQTADINNLQVGYEYYLQWDGTGNASVSTDDKEELPKPCTPVQASQYTIDDTEYTWDGNAKKPTVSANTDGVGNPTSVVYKQGNTEVENPINVGTYDVYVSSNDGTTYCGANNLEVGSFEIKCKAGNASDLYTLKKASEEYVGAPRGTGVTPENGAGTASIIYKQGDTEVSPINVGIYDVYITSEAGTGYCAITTPTKIGTFEVTCKTATASQYTISQTSFTYDGSAKKPTVSKASGATAAGEVTSTVYKQGDTTVDNPINAGTYDIYITTEAGTGYCALTNFKLGSFTINGKDPVESDFTYTNSKNYTGTVLSADVAWKTGLAAGTGGAITTYYKKKDAADNTYTTTKPSAVGVYTIAVTTVAGGNYAAATTKIVLGDFTINEVCDPITSLTWSITSGSKTTYCSGDKVQVTMTYNGTTANSYSRSGNHAGNIDFNASSLASGVVYTFTIINSGTISLTLTGCDGKTATTPPLTFNVMEAPATPTVKVVNNIIKCGNDFTQYGKIQITNYNPNYSYKIGVNNDPLDPSAIDANGNISGLTLADKFTLYAINSCGVATPSAQFEITETDNKPTITGNNSFQPGGSTVLTSDKGANTIWKTTGGKLSAEKGASVTFSADTNDKYTITAIYNDCETEFVVSVQDDLYVWVRRPIKKETAYTQFYHEDQNSSQGGDLYYLEFASKPNNYQDYNHGGVKAEKNFPDKEGYMWYGFKISKTAIENEYYFTVHAPNDGGKKGDSEKWGGFYTHTKVTRFDKDMTSDLYFVMDEVASGSSEGWNINAPVVVRASGDAMFNGNNFADFVPLYVKDANICGKEVVSFEWQKSTTQNGEYTTYNGKSGEGINNIRTREAGWYRCIVTYGDGKGTATSNAIQVTNTGGTDYSFTSKLPILMVNTNGVGFPKEPASGFPSVDAENLKAKVSVDVIIKKGENIVYDRKARMNYRGSSSLNFKKKSYAFVSGQDSCVFDKSRHDYVKTKKEKMLNLLGDANYTTSDKDWVLYAATPDPSMMRNRLVFDLYQQMRPGEWGVHSTYVELIVDGEYQGVYVFMDKITANEGRVNITNSDGFIVKFDKTDVADRVEKDGDQKTFATTRTGTKNSSDGITSYDTKIDQRFEIEYPEKEDIQIWDAFYGKVQQRFEDFETALANKQYDKVRAIIDYDSWADWFILSEFIKNQDGFRASNIFIYNGGKIMATPLWDQELSMDNRTRMAHGSTDPEGLLSTTSSVYDDAFPAPFWFTGGDESITGGLLNDPCFVALVKTKWAEYQAGVLSASNCSTLVAKYHGELDDNIRSREVTKWPYTQDVRGTTNSGKYMGYYNNKKEGDPNHYSYNASKNAITDYASKRSTKLDSNSGLGKAINGLEGEALIFTITPSSAETTPWQQVQLTVNAPAGYEYTLNVDELKADNAIIKENGDSYGIKIPRPAAWGVGGNGTEQSKQYNVTATIEVSGENACGTISNNTATSVVKLNDITEACNPEIIKK